MHHHLRVHLSAVLLHAAPLVRTKANPRPESTTVGTAVTQMRESERGGPVVLYHALFVTIFTGKEKMYCTKILYSTSSVDYLAYQDENGIAKRCFNLCSSIKLRIELHSLLPFTSEHC